MLRKTLIVEDFQSTLSSIERSLADLQIYFVQTALYCDDALQKIEQALLAQQPYEVLITDLSFVDDEHPQKIKSGKELIAAARKIQPNLKIIVFSSEKKDGVITQLFNDLKINAFVHKGRNDMPELKIALEKIFQNENYISSESRTSFQKMNTYEFTNYDLSLITLLASGIIQKDIPEILQDKNIKPNSLSSVEKRLNLLRTSLDVSSNHQLVSFCKDLGII